MTLPEAFETSDLTPRQLAGKLDVSESHVYRWLNRVHTPNRFYRKLIAKHLAVDVDSINWERNGG